MQHTGKVVTQNILRSELWDELVDAQYLRVYVRQLRRKIEVDPERPRFVLTETGVEAGQEFASPSDGRSLLLSHRGVEADRRGAGFDVPKQLQQSGAAL